MSTTWEAEANQLEKLKPKGICHQCGIPTQSILCPKCHYKLKQKT